VTKLYPLIDSLIRIMLTIVFFYVFKHFFEIENDLVLAFISVLCGFITFRIFMLVFNKITTKNSAD